MRPRRSAASVSLPGSAISRIGRWWSTTSAGPGGELATQADVDAATQMAPCEAVGLAYIQDLRTLLGATQKFLQSHAPQNLQQIVLECGTLARVENGVVREIGRSVRLIRAHDLNELFARHGPQRIVVATLLAQRRDRLRRNVFAAQRTGAVRWIYKRRIRQRQQLRLQRVVKAPAQLHRTPAQRSAEIGPPHVADEERVAGQHRPGMVGV